MIVLLSLALWFVRVRPKNHVALDVSFLSTEVIESPDHGVQIRPEPEPVPEPVPEAVLRAGAHPAVGGDGDVPCSGDLLLAALAACQETTVRMVAANMGIDLEELQVTVEGDWDPRGTLAMGKEFPIGITAIRAHTRVVVRGDERGERAERLLRSAERYCVVLGTLRDGVPVESTFTLESR
ncbi:MAG: OsmC family protein [Actinomycetes bacterium]